MGSKSFKEAMGRKKPGRKVSSGSKSFSEALSRAPKKKKLVDKKPIFKEEWGSTKMGGRSSNYLNRGKKKVSKDSIIGKERMF